MAEPDTLELWMAKFSKHLSRLLIAEVAIVTIYALLEDVGICGIGSEHLSVVVRLNDKIVRGCDILTGNSCDMAKVGHQRKALTKGLEAIAHAVAGIVRKVKGCDGKVADCNALLLCKAGDTAAESILGLRGGINTLNNGRSGIYRYSVALGKRADCARMVAVVVGNKEPLDALQRNIVLAERSQNFTNTYTCIYKHTACRCAQIETVALAAAGKAEKGYISLSIHLSKIW